MVDDAELLSGNEFVVQTNRAPFTESRSSKEAMYWMCNALKRFSFCFNVCFHTHSLPVFPRKSSHLFKVHVFSTLSNPSSSEIGRICLVSIMFVFNQLHTGLELLLEEQVPDTAPGKGSNHTSNENGLLSILVARSETGDWWWED